MLRRAAREALRSALAELDLRAWRKEAAAWRAPPMNLAERKLGAVAAFAFSSVAAVAAMATTAAGVGLAAAGAKATGVAVATEREEATTLGASKSIREKCCTAAGAAASGADATVGAGVGRYCAAGAGAAVARRDTAKRLPLDVALAVTMWLLDVARNR